EEGQAYASWFVGAGNDRGPPREPQGPDAGAVDDVDHRADRRPRNRRDDGDLRWSESGAAETVALHRARTPLSALHRCATESMAFLGRGLSGARSATDKLRAGRALHRTDDVVDGRLQRRPPDRPRSFLDVLWRRGNHADPRPRLRRSGRAARRAADGDPEPRSLAIALRRPGRCRWQVDEARRHGSSDHRCPALAGRPSRTAAGVL